MKNYFEKTNKKNMNIKNNLEKFIDLKKYNI